ncbi:uncharacterized protein LOC130746511 [Lotus japonicus]|uniref:uncharacterized protein LOC130746511 n=1 Tax=Lotus japonicus TaxID=34305 RepID=UPI00258F0E3B|nr:uncharacterized protein LOC130746511 [Lotus japonicus]
MLEAFALEDLFQVLTGSVLDGGVICTSEGLNEVCLVTPLDAGGCHSGVDFPDVDPDAVVVGGSCVPKRRGRPKKARGCGLNGSASRSRGRPRKIKARDSVLEDGGSSSLIPGTCELDDSLLLAEGSALVNPLASSSVPDLGTVSRGRFFTRAKKAWLLGKVVGMVFEGSDIEAIQGLEKVFEEHFVP